jgi:hypothetical protein
MVAFGGGSHPAGCGHEGSSKGKGVDVVGRLRLANACDRGGIMKSSEGR